MSKHTPGPWEVFSAQRGFVITAADGVYDVAVVRDIGEHDNEANARLIAAAPELLEALKLYVSICGNTAACVSRESASIAYDTAAAAIAKAEGGA